jgi:protein involved in polysaccharide export with SLBB domain
MLPSVRIGRLSLLVLPLIVSACKSTADSENALPPPVRGAALPVAAQPPAKSMVFVAGDSLELFVKEDSTLNGVYEVREGGYIVIPRAGRIQVAGLDRLQAENRVKEVLQSTQLTQATVLVERRAKDAAPGAAGVSIAEMPKLMVFITGAVPRSGVHHIPVPSGRPLGAYEALLISGGVNKFAREDRVEIFRTDSEGRRRRAVVDLRPVRLGQADDPPLGEGDIIHVPEKVFGF